MTREGSTQSRTLEAIKTSGEITVKGIQSLLQLPGPEGYARICHAVRDLTRAGYIERSGRAQYRYVGEPKGLDYADGQKRMVRIIRIRTKRSEPVTARQLAELAEVSFDWAKRYIALGMRHGYLERVGTARTGANIPVRLYQGVQDKLNDEWPVIKRHAKTEEVDQAVANVREMSLKIAHQCNGWLRTMLEVKETLGTMMAAVDRAIELMKKGS